MWTDWNLLRNPLAFKSLRRFSGDFIIMRSKMTPLDHNIIEWKLIVIYPDKIYPFTILMRLINWDSYFDKVHQCKYYTLLRCKMLSSEPITSLWIKQCINFLSPTSPLHYHDQMSICCTPLIHRFVEWCSKVLMSELMWKVWKRIYKIWDSWEIYDRIHCKISFSCHKC